MEPVELEADFEVGAVKVVFKADTEDPDRPQDLPALMFQEGSILTAWSLTDEEREAILRGASVLLWTSTYGKPLQPLALRVQGVKYPEEM